jgi:hypothetical protein
MGKAHKPGGCESYDMFEKKPARKGFLSKV